MGLTNREEQLVLRQTVALESIARSLATIVGDTFVDSVKRQKNINAGLDPETP